MKLVSGNGLDVAVLEVYVALLAEYVVFPRVYVEVLDATVELAVRPVLVTEGDVLDVTIVVVL